MNQVAIQPGEAHVVPFEVMGGIEIRVSMDGPVNICVLDDAGLERYRDGDRGGVILGSYGLSDHAIRTFLGLPRWYLVIENGTQITVTGRFLVSTFAANPVPSGIFWPPGGRGGRGIF